MTTLTLITLTAALLVTLWCAIDLWRAVLAADKLVTAQRERIAIDAEATAIDRQRIEALEQAVVRQVEHFDAQLAYIAGLEETVAKLDGIACQKAYWYVCLTQPVMDAPTVLARVRKFSSN